MADVLVVNKFMYILVISSLLSNLEIKIRKRLNCEFFSSCCILFMSDQSPKFDELL